VARDERQCALWWWEIKDNGPVGMIHGMSAERRLDEEKRGPLSLFHFGEIEKKGNFNFNGPFWREQKDFLLSASNHFELFLKYLDRSVVSTFFTIS
jgi:hypothetical protein